MQNFTEIERIDPIRRGSNERIKDYKEIYELFKTNDAATQAERCVQCGDPYCHNKCPLHNYIPFWLKSIANIDKELAFKLSNETNPFPEITGRICPHDRLCEGACTLNQDGFGAVTIGAIETFISENGFKHGLKPNFPGVSSNKKIAIIGSGPAGMSVATYLLRAGVGVDMYEKASRPGGLLTYGIPNFKLNKKVVERRYEWLQEAGLNLHLNKEVGKDITFAEIARDCDGIFIGIGAQKPRLANIKNEDAEGTMLALDFLVNIQKKLFGEEYDKRYDVRDKNVVVIGGGDTAMDCVRTAIREGAKSAKCLYRRDRANMPGSKKEIKNAYDEGAIFVFNVTPEEVVVNSEGKVIAIEMKKTKLGEKDSSGRQKVEVLKGSNFRVEADVIIFSLGFEPETPSFLAENGIEVNKWGGIIVDKNYETSKKGIYSGGDCYRGADLVVRAANDGKEAAHNIIKSLGL
ncbi:MAG: glutamate synthase subunit beta [Epsilonproteobacteria bacterium]|nr:glutamate synthase subunit beta [Campylobacterota bacterium]